MANSVPNPVQRLRYFDGEYLRSYDFTDEQSYHIEMRRLMNLKLHLHGIVYGLEIVQDQDSVPSANTYFYSISPGMAIDKSGREIVVPAPYSLTNVLTGPDVNANSWYEVWICYQESETGLPAAGYLDCNVKNQNTRWQETFQVQLIPTKPPIVVTECGGVRLGVIHVVTSPSGLGLAIPGPVNLQTYNTKRHYVGIRAQSVEAPDHVDPDTFDITAMTTAVPDKPLPGYLDVHPGVFNHGNVIVKKNLVVGDDFALDKSSNPSLPNLTAATVGDVKITGDMFLQGNFYGFNPSVGSSGQWQGLQQYIQAQLQVPGIVVSTAPTNILISPQSLASSPAVTGQFAVPGSITAPFLAKVGQIMIAITGIYWNAPTTFSTDWGLSPAAISVSVVPYSFVQSSPTSKDWNLVVTWTAPNPVSNGAEFVYPVTSVDISYVAVFLPPSP